MFTLHIYFFSVVTNKKTYFNMAYTFDITSAAWLVFAVVALVVITTTLGNIIRPKYDTDKGPCGSEHNGGASQKDLCCESQWGYCNVGTDLDKIKCMKDRGCVLTEGMCATAGISYTLAAGEKCGAENWGSNCSKMCCLQQWDFCKKGATKGQCMLDRGCPVPKGDCDAFDYDVNVSDKSTHCNTDKTGGKECLKECAQTQAVFCNNNGGPKNMQCMLDRGVPMCASATDVGCYPNVYSNLTTYPNTGGIAPAFRGKDWSRNGGTGCTKNVWDFNVTKQNKGPDPNGLVQCSLPQQGGKKCSTQCCEKVSQDCDGQKGIFCPDSCVEQCKKDRGC